MVIKNMNMDFDDNIFNVIANIINNHFIFL